MRRSILPPYSPRRWSFARSMWPFAVTLLAIQLAGFALAYTASNHLSAWTIIIVCALATTGTLAAMTLAAERHWTGPVHRLNQAAEELAREDWSTAITPEGSPDVRALAERINSIGTKARRQWTELREQWRVMQALVDTLPDPMMLVEGHRRITLINSAAGRLLGTDPTRAVNRWLGEIVKDRALLETFDAIPPAVLGSPPGRPLEREIFLERDGQRLTYQAVAARTTDGVLLVLRDVTALAETLRMKTDFVANASHELRTPLAAIKAAFETLREIYIDDPAQTDRCVHIIDGHLRRLEEMLRDLLDLSRLENPELHVELTPVHPADLFASLNTSLGSMAADRNIQLHTLSELPPGQSFTSDLRLLDLILKNLAENAIKFTPPNGTVTVTLSPLTTGNSQPATLLQVADTGIGIPPEHLHRVFERFYQVNPARTGAAGRGTGLGLAIVKHAVSALGGTVTIESPPNQGTTITCLLP